jgi:cobalt-zinc-cadmium efflux system protein
MRRDRAGHDHAHENNPRAPDHASGNDPQAHEHAQGHDGARGHDHDHDHHHTRANERTRLALAIAATSFILVVEIAGGLLSHSLALLSDAGHMFSDVVGQVLSLAALVIAARPSDSRRTYGWYRIEILAALLNGLTLIVLSATLLYEGALRLRAPVEVHTRMMLIVAAIGLAANLVGAWLLHGARSLNTRGAYLHVLTDTLSSVAVLVGGTLMALLHGAWFIDPMLSMAIGVFILYSAFKLVREAVDVLLEAVPRGIDLAGVTHAIDRVEGVAKVHDLHIWTITSGLYALSAHIVVAPDHAGDGDRLIGRVKEMLLREFAIAHTTLQIESGDYDHACHVC